MQGPHRRGARLARAHAPGRRRPRGLADRRRRLRRHQARARHLRRRPQLPRRDGALRDGPVEPRHDPGRPHVAAATTTATHHIKGFSLTHLSGAGCSLYGDFPFLPTTEPLDSLAGRRRRRRLDGQFQPGFSHADESGRPRLLLGPAQPRPRRRDRRRADRDDPHRDGALHLSPQPARQRPRSTPAAAPSPTTSPRCRSTRPLARSTAPPPAASSAASARATASTSPPSSTAASPPTAPGRQRAAEPGATAAERQPGAGGEPADHRPGRRLRQLRHPPQPRRHRPGRRLLRQRRRRPRQPRRRKRRRRLRRGRQPRRTALEQCAGADPRQRRPARACLDTFYTALYHACWRRGPSATSAAPTSAWTALLHRGRGRTQYADFSGWDIYRSADPAALDAGAASGPAT